MNNLVHVEVVVNYNYTCFLLSVHDSLEKTIRRIFYVFTHNTHEGTFILNARERGSRNSCGFVKASCEKEPKGRTIKSHSTLPI